MSVFVCMCGCRHVIFTTKPAHLIVFVCLVKSVFVKCHVFAYVNVPTTLQPNAIHYSVLI